MGEIKNFNIRLKENIDQKDYEDINNLQKLCIATDQTALKLELEYKLNRFEGKSDNLNKINEFMFYDNNVLVGYIGICSFGGDNLEVNGMVHPEYRRKGIFSMLFSLVKDEWSKRNSKNMLVLSDNRSISGLEFIRNAGSVYDHSEYEMYLKAYTKTDLSVSNIVIRQATIQDSLEIARQNCIYFDIEYKEEDVVIDSEDDEIVFTYLAEIDNKIIGKVKVEVNDYVGGIYGLGVLPEYRCKGYGRDILTWAIEKLKEMNAKEIMLQVSVINKNALKLYKSCGFEETSTMDYFKLSKK